MSDWLREQEAAGERVLQQDLKRQGLIPDEEPVIKKAAPAERAKPVEKKQEKKFIKHIKCYNTPLIPLEVATMQTNGLLWYILDTEAPSTIKLYFTMLSAAITSPVGHPKARGAYLKHIPKDEIPVWMPYGEGMKRSKIGSKRSFKDARNELVEKGLIEKTDDKSVYVIGKIVDDYVWKSFLHIKMDEMLVSTDVS